MPKMLFAEDLYSPSQVEDLAKKGMIVEKEISKSEQKSFDKALKLDRTKPDVAILGERATGGGGGGVMPKSNRDITKNYKKGGKVSSASKRADGCAIRGKTRA